MQISKKELSDKYGITLDRGTYSIKYVEDEYEIYTLKDDTLGCLLPGVRDSTQTRVFQSKATFSKLMKLLTKASKTEKIILFIESSK